MSQNEEYRAKRNGRQKDKVKMQNPFGKIPSWVPEIIVFAILAVAIAYALICGKV